MLQVTPCRMVLVSCPDSKIDHENYTEPQNYRVTSDSDMFEYLNTSILKLLSINSLIMSKTVLLTLVQYVKNTGKLNPQLLGKSEMVSLF